MEKPQTSKHIKSFKILKSKLIYLNLKKLTSTSKKIYNISYKYILLTVFKKTFAVYCDNQIK